MFFPVLRTHRQKWHQLCSRITGLRGLSSSYADACSTSSTSTLHSKYLVEFPPSLYQNPNPTSPTKPINQKKKKPPYRPPSSLDRDGKAPWHSDIPFDFQFSYTESKSEVRPIGLREPKYSPFGPNRLDRTWTGVCAPAVDHKVVSIEDGKNDPNLEEKRKTMREKIQGEPLTEAERRVLVEYYQRQKTKRQVNLGRDGLTHNMLNDIHNNWKTGEAARIKCMGVPTVDMKNICSQLEDKTNGKIIHKQCGLLILYRGRNYIPKQRPVIPLMLWKPHAPVYPRLIKTTIEGLSISETDEMRKKGLAVPALIKLAKNGYYGSLVPMVRDAFLVSELVRIDCKGLNKSDYKKIGSKLRDLVPCILVTFDKEQIVVWRGKEDSKPNQIDCFLVEKETLNDEELLQRSNVGHNTQQEQETLNDEELLFRSNVGHNTQEEQETLNDEELLLRSNVGHNTQEEELPV